MKIGIFGGSFNPPHEMHNKICEHLLSGGIVDKIILVPTGDAYNKAGLISSRHRYNMLQLLVSGRGNVEVSDFELKKRQVYTYQTLNHFKKCYKDDDIYFICGFDNLKEFREWKNYKEILDNFGIIVINRGDYENAEVENCVKSLNANIIIAELEKTEICSTEIRNSLKENQNACFNRAVLNQNVLQYIKQHNLYA